MNFDTTEYRSEKNLDLWESYFWNSSIKRFEQISESPNFYRFFFMQVLRSSIFRLEYNQVLLGKKVFLRMDLIYHQNLSSYVKVHFRIFQIFLNFHKFIIHLDSKWTISVLIRFCGSGYYWNSALSNLLLVQFCWKFFSHFLKFFSHN